MDKLILEKGIVTMAKICKQKELLFKTKDRSAIIKQNTEGV
jgi:hypothetical protein